MMAARWIRLDTTWSQSEWLTQLPAPSRLAWVELLCYVKSHGVAGSVKKPSTATLSRMWDISRNAIDAMFSASFQDGAVVMDGPDCIITGWGDRQMDSKAAERMRAYRGRKKGLSPLSDPPNDTPVTRNRPNKPVARAHATLTETETLTETKTTSSPKSPPSEQADPQPPDEPSGVDREDDQNDLKQEIQKHQRRAKLNIVAIHGGTEKDVKIEGHRVGVGIEIKRYRGLCEERLDPPHIIAAAIAHIPAVCELEPPVSLARWTAEDGQPIYEQCVGRAYKGEPSGVEAPLSKLEQHFQKEAERKAAEEASA